MIANKERLQSQNPFVPATRKLLIELSKLGIRTEQWTDYKWDVKYSEDQSKLRLFVPRPNARPFEMDLHRSAWGLFNRLRTCFGRFHSSVDKWRLASTSICECGAVDKKKSHLILILESSLHRVTRGCYGLLVLEDETGCWLNNIAPTFEADLP